MDAPYIKNRDRSFINRYKLNRRTQEISDALALFGRDRELSLLDIGSADGYLLYHLKNTLKIKCGIGIEPVLECIKMKPVKNLIIINGIAESLPFCNNSFDAIVAASVIDHLKNFGNFLEESHRALREDGLLIATAIIPFYDKLANLLKVDNGLHPHIKTYSPPEMGEILKLHHFEVILSKRFALPSFGLMPFEKHMERFFNRPFLNKLMFYSIVVGKRIGTER